MVKWYTCPKLIERFFSKVNKFGPVPPSNGDIGNCWLWKTPTRKDGYCTISTDKKHRYVHRLSALIHKIDGHEKLLLNDKATQTCHHCDVRHCVNPNHLYIGSAKTNAQDKVQRGRTLTGDKNPSRVHPELHPRGERIGTSKLKSHQVIELRNKYANGASQRSLSREYRIDRKTVKDIVTRKWWKHLL